MFAADRDYSSAIQHRGATVQAPPTTGDIMIKLSSLAITTAVARNRYDAEISESELRGVLAREIAAILAPIQKPLVMDDSKKPFVILVAGVTF